MLGDLLLSIKSFLKQTFCIHDYTVHNRYIGNQLFTTYECIKCGRTKVK